MRLMERGANRFRRRPRDKIDVHQRSTIEIDSVLRAAFNCQADQYRPA